MNNNRADIVKSKLVSNDTIKVKDAWIRECVNFFISQEPAIDNETLYQQVMEQFLLSDMKESSNPVIPVAVLQKKQAFTLNGTFILQMQFLVDIAESPYEQWRRLHNLKSDEVEELHESKTFQTKKKRVFKLELTDGFKTIYGMEYVTISSLSSKISPGAKLKIVGPLQVINHILLLGPQNLTVLGGDADHLLIVNAYENVLLRALGKPTTDTPIMDYKDEALICENNNVAPRPDAGNAMNVNNQMQVDSILDGINFDEEEDVDMDMLMQIEQVERQNKSQENNVINQLPTDDDIILSQMDIEEIDMTLRAAVEAAQEITVASLSPRVRADELLIPSIIIPDSYDDEDRNAFLAKPSSSKTSLAQSSREYFDDSVPKKIARIEPTPMITVSADIYKYKTTNGDHLVTVDQYVLLRSTEQMKRDYVVLGRVQNVTMKTLRIRDNQWHLNVEIGDSYSYKLLSVKLHNKILEKLSGRTGSEIQNDYIETKTRPHIKADIEKALERLKTQLSTLESFMRIEMKFQQPHPNIYEVVELLEDSSENNQAYLRKIKDEKLEKVG